MARISAAESIVAFLVIRELVGKREDGRQKQKLVFAIAAIDGNGSVGQIDRVAHREMVTP